MFMKKLFVFIMLAFAFAGGVGFFVSDAGFSERKLNFDNTTNVALESDVSTTNEDCPNFDLQNQNSSPLYVASDIVYDVLLFEFRDCKNFFTQERIDYINRIFNDTDSSNNTYSVHEYFNELSYGKVSVFANIYIYTDSHDKSFYNTNTKGYSEEYGTFATGMASATVCYKEHSSVRTGAMIVFSTDAVHNLSSRLWGHAFFDRNFVSITDEEATAPIIVHEIMHNFGIADMYNTRVTVQGDAPVGYSDIMSQTHYGAINTYMYNKSVLGWVDSSVYEDGNETEIEQISNDGTYTLCPTIDQSKHTKAYKFGVKQGDRKIYFMVEYRKPQRNKMDGSILSREGLVVYRVNEHYKQQGNYNKTYSTYETYAFRPKNNYFYSSNAEHFTYKNETIGNLADENYYLYYEDKSICKCVISNMVYNSNGTVSFEFRNFQNEDVVAGVVGSDTTRLNDVDVFVNGVYKTTTFHRGYFILKGVKDKDIISFQSKNGKYVFDSLIAKINTLNLVVEPSKVNPTVKIEVNGIYENEKYNLYQQNGAEWKLIDTFISNQTAIKYLLCGERYKISGLAIEDYEFVVLEDVTIILEQHKLPQKDILGTVADTLGDFYEDVCDSVGETANTVGKAISDGINTIIDFFSHMF